MKDSPAEFAFTCPAEEISAFIDGELPTDVEAALEQHLIGCEICRRELNDQKGFLLALSDTLEREIPIELPENFTRSVVVNAESKVSGLRDRREHSPALIIGSVFFLVAAAAVGGFAGILSPVALASEKFLALGRAMFQVVADLAYAVASMFRTILQTQTFAAAFTYIAICLAIVVVLYLGTRSVRRYFRSSGT